MRRLVALVLAVAPVAAHAQDHSGHAMPGMAMPAPATPAVDPHAGHQMPAQADPHAGHATPAAPEGTDLPAGTADAPPAPLPHYADRIWGAAAMARGRAAMMHDEGGAQTFGQALVNLAEVQVRDGRDGYRWDAQAWLGGDRDRLVLTSEGEGDLGGRVGAAEVQALYRRAIGPYFNLEAGIRQDIRPTPARTWAAIGVEGLAPYWFEVEAAAFVSTRGEVTARAEAWVDQRLTQRLILQPRVELNLAAQDIAAIGVGSGVSTAEAGLRLRYELRRQFAPYVGVSWERRYGDTARLSRAAGEGTGGTAFVAGIRAWF